MLQTREGRKATLKKGEWQVKITSRFLTALIVISSMYFFVTGVTAADKYPVPQTVKDWVSEGKYMKFEGLDVFRVGTPDPYVPPRK